MFEFPILFNLIVVFCLSCLLTTTNVLISVLLLISVTFLFSLYIIALSSIFVGLLYLAIYVGAVTVFILFVVMMTDLSLSSEAYEINQKHLIQSFVKDLKPSNDLSTLEVIVIFSLIVYFVSVIEFGVTVVSSQFIPSSYVVDVLKNTSFDNHTTELAFDLLNQHLAPFLVLGLVILLSLIGSIFIITQDSHHLLLGGIGIRTHLESRGTSSPLLIKSQNMDTQLLVSSKNAIHLSSSTY